MDHHKVLFSEAGSRVDAFVARLYPQYSRSILKTLFNDQKITVNHKQVKPSYSLSENDVIDINLDSFNQPTDHIDLPIIFENDDVVIVDKPAGVLTHSKGQLNTEGTVASFLSDKITDKELTGNRAGIVHRLDRATSGVIAGAKTNNAQKFLQKQFAKRNTKKTYYAIVEGWPKQDEAIIDVPIGRNPKHPQTFMATAQGKTAQTYYKVIQKAEIDEHKHALLQLKPTTGRTHQLRVHLKHIGNPIIGDAVYGSLLKAPRMMLHAQLLELTLPDKTRKVFVSEIPTLMMDYINAKQ